MAYETGWAAMNLDMPARIPRTEYSAEGHWDLVRVVTGLDVRLDSAAEVKAQASTAFMRAWQYDFFWNVLIERGEFGGHDTDMGHSEYAAGGVDRREARSSPFKTPEDVLSFDPRETFGIPDHATLIRRFEENYHAGCRAHDFGVNMTGTYITLISGLIDLFGWDMLLLAAGTDLKRFGELANRYAAWMQPYYDALADADVPVVLLHDDIVWASGPIFRPAWYREYVFPNYAKYLTPLLESGKKILYCSDGNFDLFVDDIAATGVHGFIFEPLTDLRAIIERYGQTHVIMGNADTRILLSGSKADIRAEVERCLIPGRKCPGYFLAVGNHIPANTPLENALYYNDVYEELCRR